MDWIHRSRRHRRCFAALSMDFIYFAALSMDFIYFAALSMNLHFHDSLILGSTTPYSRSLTKLTRMYVSAMTRIDACTCG